jgi:hypothetical protein
MALEGSPRRLCRRRLMAQGSSGKAERQFLLRSLTGVGRERPVGYLPLYTLTEFAEAEPDRLAADALARRLAAAQFGSDVLHQKRCPLYLPSQSSRAPTQCDCRHAHRSRDADRSRYVRRSDCRHLDPARPSGVLDRRKAFGKQPQLR